MSVRMITKTKGRTFARVHCAQFYMCKGTDIDDKPYGVIPTGLLNPLGLVYDNTTLKITVKAGQLYCYGRQVVVEEDTEAIDLSTITFSSEKVYGTIYIRIDLNDVVDQYAEIGFVYNTDAHVDFSEDQQQDNLYKRANGIFDIPLGRFIYKPAGENGTYFFNLERLVRTLDTEARAKTEKVQAYIGNTAIEKIFKNGESIVEAVESNHSGSADGLGDTKITQALDGVWTANRKYIATYSTSLFNYGNVTDNNVVIDTAHQVKAHIWDRHIQVGQYETTENATKQLQLTMSLQKKNPSTAIGSADWLDVRTYNFAMAFDITIGTTYVKYYLAMKYAHDDPATSKLTPEIVTITESQYNKSLHEKIAMIEYNPTSKKVIITGLMKDTTTYTAQEMDEEQGVLRDVTYRYSKPTFKVGNYDSAGNLLGTTYVISGFTIYADFLYKGSVQAS
jgi:hypothetical protein